jgi:FixJ family two-component response regulator
MNSPTFDGYSQEMADQLPSDLSSGSERPAWALRVGPDPGVVAIVDDDAWVLKSLGRLMKSAGFTVETFVSAEDFLQRDCKTVCVVLDIGLPGMSGLELQRQLAIDSPQVSVVFVSAHDEPELRSQALAWGAVAFLRKPFDDEALLDAISLAVK